MPDSVFKVPRVKECIEYIKTTYGGCIYTGMTSDMNGTRYYHFYIRAWEERNSNPNPSLTTAELRHAFLNGW